MRPDQIARSKTINDTTIAQDHFAYNRLISLVDSTTHVVMAGSFLDTKNYSHYIYFHGLPKLSTWTEEGYLNFLNY